MSLYNATGGADKWLNHRNWGTSGSYCQWEGIKCLTNSHIEINQSRGGLTGTIPSHFGTAGAKVEALYLSDNAISGSLPRDLVKFRLLKTLDIRNNQISGTIPDEYSRFSSLRTFWIEGNVMSGTVSNNFRNLLTRCSAQGGCKMSGNPFNCPVPSWIPLSCDMHCAN